MSVLHSPFQAPRRKRRVQLAVPASNEKMIKKAAESDADHVFLDLEDAVAPNAKQSARHSAVQALNMLDWSGKTRCVRINDHTTPYFLDDLIEIVAGARDNLDTIMIPKAVSAADVITVDTVLGQLEAKFGLSKRIGIEVLIEEVDGLIHVDEISHASPRLEALIFGMGDYSASHGIDLAAAREGYPADVWHFARFRMTMAARSVGIDAIDGPYATIPNIEGYKHECNLAQLLGMNGKWALHPTQIEHAIAAFTPSPGDVQTARGISTAYEKAQRDGLGAIIFEGKFIDVAVVRRARKVLEKADLFCV